MCTENHMSNCFRLASDHICTVLHANFTPYRLMYFKHDILGLDTTLFLIITVWALETIRISSLLIDKLTWYFQSSKRRNYNLLSQNCPQPMKMHRD